MYRVLCGALCFALAATSCSSGVSEEDLQAALDAESAAAARVEELETDLETTKSDLVAARAAGETARAERDVATEERDEREQAVNDLLGELAVAAEDLARTEQELAASVVRAALAATASLTTYRVELIEEFDNGTSFGAIGLIAGPDNRLDQEFFGVVTETMTVDGRSLLRARDGSWLETVTPERMQGRKADPVAAIWQDLRLFEVTDGDVTAGTFVLACPEDLPSLSVGFGWICDSDAGIAEITLDPTATFIATVHAEGDIPTFPGRTEVGSLTITIEVSEEDLVLELPEEIDQSGLECLGDALGVSRAAAAELSILIDDNATVENQLLFGSCGYSLFPPGVDFAP